MMAWIGCQIPFRTFGSPDGFIVDNVGISPLKSGGLTSAVQIDHLPIIGSFPGNFFIPAHGNLIVAVEKIDFKSCNSPVG